MHVYHSIQARTQELISINNKKRMHCAVLTEHSLKKKKKKIYTYTNTYTYTHIHIYIYTHKNTNIFTHIYIFHSHSPKLALSPYLSCQHTRSSQYLVDSSSYFFASLHLCLFYQLPSDSICLGSGHKLYLSSLLSWGNRGYLAVTIHLFK